jgi:hypothetical protein
MKNFTLLCLITFACISQNAFSQISGTVFKDFNFNGTQQTSGFPIEPGVYGVQVKAFNAANVQLGATKTTSASGAFSFSTGEVPAATAVRIEFTAPDGSFDSKFASGTNGSAVQFTTSPSATVNYAISSQAWYSNTANPYVATNGSTNGNGNGGGSAGTNNNLYVFPYDMSDMGTGRLPNSQLGSVYGLTFQRTSRILLMSAYLKRHTGFGPNGISAIYKSTVSSAGIPSTSSLMVNVSTIGINVGTDPRTVTLPAASSTRNADVGVFAEIGKRGIGGMSLSEDGNDLYLVNMFEKKLHRIAVGNPVKASFTSADVTTWLIPDPSTAGMTWHPMACKTANGKVYVGGVVVFEKTTNHNLATDTIGSRGIVYEFDPATSAFTEVLRFPFNYRRGFSNADVRYPAKCNWWCAWQNNGNGGATDPLQADYNTAGSGAYTGGIYYPQPMISDIDFDVNGEMVIGVRDRFGDQMGYQNLSNDGLPTGTGFGGANNYFRALSSGEILRAGKNTGANAYTIENQGSVTSNGTTVVSDGVASGNLAVGGSWTSGTGTPYGGKYGPGWGGTAGTIPAGGPNPGTLGGYYYFNQNFTTATTPGTLNASGSGALNSHYCKTDAGLALLPGKNEVMHTLMDPVATAYTQGVSTMFNTGASAGDMSQRLQLNISVTNDPTNMGKAGGLGDLEILTDYQPIEIGNRVWNDANGNGIQDAGETPIVGVPVQIVGPGTDGLLGTADDVVLSSATTSASGEYYFNTLTTADSRKPATFIGVGTNDILPGFSYQIRINPAHATLTGLQLTKADAASNTVDNIDNDATFINGYAAVNFNTAGTDHNFDFGFKGLATLGDKVWLDNGLGGGTSSNGVQDGTEPGVAGVTVTLFNSSNVPIATTTTDAYGNYLFDNLTPANYTVGFTLPPNYTFTTQTNTTDDNNTTGSSTTGSDANVTTGRSYTITLSSGENNRNIDAGLIFNTPAITQSLGNTVWLDTNPQNGVQNGTEPGVAGVTVTLYNAGVAVASTITDANGKYLFNNIPTSAAYTVGFSLPVGMRFTTQGGTLSTDLNSDANVTTGRTNTITVSSGDNITYVDAGIYPIATTKASLGDRVWNDLDHDGIQDAGEQGVGNITVNLYTNTGTFLATTTTDPSGYYMFTNLNAGDYMVEFIKPAAYTYSPQKVTSGGATLGTDSDPNTGTGRTSTINLKEGDRNTSVDAGIYITAPSGNLKLGDKVWNDLDRDGIQDANEPGVAGITVMLYRNGPDGLAGTPDDIVVATTYTDANGNYLFTDLSASTGTTTNYNVFFTNLPANFSITILNQTAGGGTTSTDNNANSLSRTATINLTVDDLTIDAGIFQGVAAGKGTLGDRVWQDLDGDGVQDAGEPGVGGVTVTLQKDINGDGDFADAGEASFATTYTDALGGYLFGGLDAGSYKVQFSNMPVGQTISPKDAVTGTDETDSDGDNAGTTIAGGTVSTTGVYTLATGDDNLTVDLGIVPIAGRNTLGDHVWFDTDENGVQDANEKGVAGVAVTLYNSGGTAIAYTATDCNGNYLFTNLADGTYSVGFTNLPAGFDLTTKSASNDLTGSDADRISAKTTTVALTYASGGTIRDNRSLDAGLISTRAALGNYVWLDADGDGVQDAGEKGISGVTVILYANDGATILASTITDANGRYFFPNLTAGSYVVGFTTVPGNLEFTQQVTPGDNQNDTNSDANTVTGKTSVIVLSDGEIDITIDAGLRPTPTATVGDYVWSDLDSDGLQGANEPGIGGVLATLYDSGNNPIGSAVTDGSGKYLITNVPPGTGYYIIFTNAANNPTGSPIQPTFTLQGGNPLAVNTSHVDGTGKTHTFTVNNGDNIRYIDAGIKDYPGRAILPIQSIEVAATLHNVTTTVTWVTDNEINTSKFIVERSIDNVNFTAVGSRDAAGTYAGKSYYTFDDNIAALNANIIYYRIKAIDANARFTYSKVVAIRISNITGVRTWPSPFTSQVFVSMFSSTAQQVQVQLTDFAGKTVKQSQYGISKGNNQLMINDLANLPAATYVIKITAANCEVLSTQTLLKQ